MNYIAQQQQNLSGPPCCRWAGWRHTWDRSWRWLDSPCRRRCTAICRPAVHWLVARSVAAVVPRTSDSSVHSAAQFPCSLCTDRPSIISTSFSVLSIHSLRTQDSLQNTDISLTRQQNATPVKYNLHRQQYSTLGDCYGNWLGLQLSLQHTKIALVNISVRLCLGCLHFNGHFFQMDLG